MNHQNVLLATENRFVSQGFGTESYLNLPVFIAAAEITDADAIHPRLWILAEMLPLPMQ